MENILIILELFFMFLLTLSVALMHCLNYFVNDQLAMNFIHECNKNNIYDTKRDKFINSKYLHDPVAHTSYNLQSNWASWGRSINQSLLTKTSQSFRSLKNDNKGRWINSKFSISEKDSLPPALPFFHKQTYLPREKISWQ